MVINIVYNCIEKFSDDEGISDKDVYIRQSKYLLSRGMKDAALENIRKSIKKYPDCYVLRTTRSFCFLQLEMWSEALNDAEEILENDTDNVQAIFCRAESLYNLCQFEKSLCAFYKGKVTRSLRKRNIS